MKIYTTKNELLGTVCGQAIELNHDGKILPRNMQKLLYSFRGAIDIDEDMVRVANMIEFRDERHLEDWLYSALGSMPEFLELNLSQAEYDNGLRARDVNDDNKRHRIGERLKSDHYRNSDGTLVALFQFIDLGALLRNIQQTIVERQPKATALNEIFNETL